LNLVEKVNKINCVLLILLDYEFYVGRV